MILGSVFKRLGQWLGFVLALMLVYWAANDAINHLVHGDTLNEGVLRLDFWLFASVFVAIFLTQRRPWLGFLVASCWALMPYVMAGAHLKVLGRMARLADLTLLLEAFFVLPMAVRIALVFCFLCLVLITVWNFSLIRWRAALVFLMPWAAVIALVMASPKAYLNVWDSLGHTAWDFSDQRTAARNGYMVATLFFHARNIVTREAGLASSNPKAAKSELLQQQAWLQDNLPDRNVYLLVLESFIDVRDLKAINLPNDYFPQGLSQLLIRDFDYARSPTFGGGTANAEFEMLCGAPALRRFGATDFNVMQGRAVACLPEQITQSHAPIASNAYKLWYFNKDIAYNSLGFKNVYAPVEYGNHGSYLNLFDDEPFMHDMDFFEQVVAFNQQLTEPTFHYALAVYGHMPHGLGDERFEKRFQVDGVEPDSHLWRVLNQSYYRYLALEQYLTSMLANDPNGLVVVVSDHVPGLGGPQVWKTLDYQTAQGGSVFNVPYAVFDRGERVSVPLNYLYELPNVIFNQLTDGAYCKAFNCQLNEAELEQRYYNLMVGSFN